MPVDDLLSGGEGARWPKLVAVIRSLEEQVQALRVRVAALEDARTPAKGVHAGDPYAEGAAAAFACGPHEMPADCPYPADSPEGIAWDRGVRGEEREPKPRKGGRRG